MTLVRLDGPRDGVVELVLDAPPRNLFGHALVDELRERIAALHAAPPRALVVRAEGELFTAGADVDVFAPLDSALAVPFIAGLVALAQDVEDLPCPTIALVHGLCLTAGLELALACDFLWATRRARFGLVEARIGITPLMGGTQRLAERAGPMRARELVMTGGLYRAATLADWGVVGEVCDDDETLLRRGRAFAARLAAGPTRAHAVTKRVVRAQLEGGARAADARIPELAAGLFDSEDFRNALRAFHDDPESAVFAGR